MGESVTTTNMVDEENISSGTPSLVTEKIKDLLTENSISTSLLPTTTNGEIPNTPPIIKHKLPKLPIIAGKPFK